MSRRDIIRSCIVVVVIFWIVLLTMPRRLTVIQDLDSRYYDKQMTLQEYQTRKRLSLMAKDKSISEQEKLDGLESLAKNLWATFRAKDALQILSEVRTRRDKIDKHYNQKSINTLLLLAGVYRDLNQLNDSAGCYEQVMKLDEKNLPKNDACLTRDQMNLAMADFLRADCEGDDNKKDKYLKGSIVHLEQAEHNWHVSSMQNKASLANIYYLEYIVNRELGNKAASEQAYREMKNLNGQLKRVYNAPLT